MLAVSRLDDIGHVASKANEIYDPAARTWTKAPTASHLPVLLPHRADGRSSTPAPTSATDLPTMATPPALGLTANAFTPAGDPTTGGNHHTGARSYRTAASPSAAPPPLLRQGRHPPRSLRAARRGLLTALPLPRHPPSPGAPRHDRRRAQCRGHPPLPCRPPASPESASCGPDRPPASQASTSDP